MSRSPSLLDRRRFLSLSAATVAAGAFPLRAQQKPAAETAKPGNLRFVFFTDTHLQPELGAADGTAKAMRRIKEVKPALCIQGGDHTFDIAAVPRERSLMLMDLYDKTEHALDGIPIHHVIGNHDVYGRDPASNVATGDPLYGKKAFEQRFNTRTYRSFDQKGYHFILLDSIQITPARELATAIDTEQLAWVAADLAATPVGTPIIVACHVPLVSSVMQYAPPGDKILNAKGTVLVSNAQAVLSLFEGHNIIAVLQATRTSTRPSTGAIHRSSPAARSPETGGTDLDGDVRRASPSWSWWRVRRTPVTSPTAGRAWNRSPAHIRRYRIRARRLCLGSRSICSDDFDRQ